MKAIFLAQSAVTFSILVVIALFPREAIAGEYQNCNVNETCNIGEFLFDDTYTPDATASCTFSSRYPNGNAFLNPPVTMTASSSGWYSYTVTIGTAEGIYPSQICCTTISDEHLCLDKTFKVVTPVVSGATSSAGSSLTAADVWNYSDRSLSSFGSLVSDIWSHSSRSLTGFGDLIAGIWSHSSRQLTNTAGVTVTIITKDDIKEIQKVTADTRKTIEQIINKPVVKTFIDEGVETSNLITKLKKTQNTADELYANVQNLKSRADILSSKWGNISKDEALSELNSLQNILSDNDGKKDGSLVSQTNWLKKSWNSLTLLTLSEQTEAAQSKIKNLIDDIRIYGKQRFSTSLAAITTHIDLLNTFTGSSLAEPDDLNLFGFLKTITNQITDLDKYTEQANRLLTEFTPENTQDTLKQTNRLENDILTLNRLPDPYSLLETPSFIKDNQTTKNYIIIKNKILGLLALIDTNKLLLARDTGETVRNVWLEEGSLIFRTVASNPSEIISQTVEVKFYLPTELNKEQIIKHDPELSIEYDPTENALFAYGRIILNPEETRTLSIEAEDIWHYSQEEIDILSNQTTELTEMLKRTSYYTQALSVKSDITVSLQKILLRQNQVVTPESHIRTYRELSLEMVGVNEKINSLKQLAVQASSQNSIFGYIGGVQIVALWGIVIIIVAGFVFLTLYMKALKNEVTIKSEITPNTKNEDYQGRPIRHRHRESGSRTARKIITLIAMAVLATGGGSLITSIAMRSINQQSPAVLGASKVIEEKLPKEVTLQLPASGKIPIRKSPAPTSPEVSSIKQEQTFFIFKRFDGWVKIGLNETDNAKDWWINETYLKK